MSGWEYIEDSGDLYQDPCWEHPCEPPEMPRQAAYDPEDPSPFDALIINRGGDESDTDTYYCDKPEHLSCKRCAASQVHLAGCCHRSHCRENVNASLNSVCAKCPSQQRAGIASSCLRQPSLTNPLFLEDSDSDILDAVPFTDISSLDLSFPPADDVTGDEDLSVQSTSAVMLRDLLAADTSETGETADYSPQPLENRHLALIGRQLAYIGDDINERYEPHFRRMAQMLVTSRRRSLPSNVTQMMKKMASSCVLNMWIRCLSASTECLNQSKRKLIAWMHAQTNTVLLGANRCIDWYSQCSAMVDDMHRHAKLSTSGLLLVTASLATAAGLAYLSWTS